MKWLRGKDLNLRPLGYEFNTWFWMDSPNADNQQDAVRCYLMFSGVSGSLVSNLLAFWGAAADTAKYAIAAFRAPGRLPPPVRPISAPSRFIALAPLAVRRSACDHKAGLAARRQFSTSFNKIRQLRHFTTFFDCQSKYPSRLRSKFSHQW
jgi:hypothetical protein